MRLALSEAKWLAYRVVWKKKAMPALWCNEALIDVFMLYQASSTPSWKWNNSDHEECKRVMISDFSEGIMSEARGMAQVHFRWIYHGVSSKYQSKSRGDYRSYLALRGQSNQSSDVHDRYSQSKSEKFEAGERGRGWWGEFCEISKSGNGNRQYFQYARNECCAVDK